MFNCNKCTDIIIIINFANFGTHNVGEGQKEKD